MFIVSRCLSEDYAPIYRASKRFDPNLWDWGLTESYWLVPGTDAEKPQLEPGRTRVNRAWVRDKRLRPDAP